MKNTKYSHILDSLTDDQVPHDLDLAPQILNRIQKKGANMNKRMKVLIPASVMLVLMAVIILTVPAVAQAIGKWFGYVPGFGLVEDANVRTLGQPVHMEQNGVTMSVTELTSTTTKTIIKFEFGPVPADALSEDITCKFPDNAPVLVLPDGSKPDLQAEGWGYADQTISMDTDFAGIPSDVDEMTLVINCINQTKKELIPWHWEIPLAFDSTLQQQVSIAPVYEVPDDVTQPAADVSPVPSGTIYGSLSVDQIVTLEDGYILSGAMTVEPGDGLTIDERDGYLEDVTILDARNKEVTSTLVPEDFYLERFAEPGNSFKWGFMLTQKDLAWPLTIVVNSVNAVSDDFAPSSFTIDVGSDPQADQVFTLDQDIPLGDRSVHVVSITRIINKYGQNGYELTFLYDPAMEFNIAIENCDPTGGGGQGGMEPGDSMSMMRSCRNVPVGEIKVTLTGRGVQNLEGPWQVTVNEPQ